MGNGRDVVLTQYEKAAVDYRESRLRLRASLARIAPRTFFESRARPGLRLKQLRQLFGCGRPAHDDVVTGMLISKQGARRTDPTVGFRIGFN